MPAKATNSDSQQRLASRLTAKEWLEVADIFAEASAAAEMQGETNGHRAAQYAAGRLRQLAMQATRRKLKAESASSVLSEP